MAAKPKGVLLGAEATVVYREKNIFFYNRALLARATNATGGASEAICILVIFFHAIRAKTSFFLFVFCSPPARPPPHTLLLQHYFPLHDFPFPSPDLVFLSTREASGDYHCGSVGRFNNLTATFASFLPLLSD